MNEKKQEGTTEKLQVNAKKASVFSRAKTAFIQKKQSKLQEIENQHLSAEENKKVEEKLVEASAEVKSSGEKKKKIRNIVLFAFNIALVVGILVWNVLDSGEDFSPLNIKNVRFPFFLVVLLLLATIVFVDVLTVHRMVYRKTYRSRWRTSYKALSILRYYDAITPLATGGQPFMVTYFTSRDVPASTALSIPIAKLVFQKFAWLTITLVCLIISFTKGMGAFVSSASIIGYLLALILIVAILFISFSKKVGKKLVSVGVSALVKLRLVKNYDKCYGKVMGVVEDYQNIMKEYSKSKLDVLYLVVLHAIRIVCIYSIPYFIYCIFPYTGGKVASYSDFFIFTALIDLASSFIPLPGGTGMNEITFTAIFKDYFLGNTFWALLIWRFCTYYFYLLQGIGVITYDTVYGNRKYRWVKKSRALQEESQTFKRVQIENFRQERQKRRKKQEKSQNF